MKPGTPTPSPSPPAGGGWRHRDHTRGSLVSSLFVLALPLIASGVLGGAIYQVADLSFLARLGDAPLAAVTITNQTVRQIAFLLAMGLSFAAQTLVSQAVGAGDLERAGRIAGQSLTLGLGMGTAIAVLGLAFPETIFALPGPDPSFSAHGVPYVRLVFLLHFGVIGTLLFGGILGGAGDTITPLLVQLLQYGVAIFAEWLLIFGHWGAPELGVRGVALGTAAGQAVAMGLGMWMLFRGNTRVKLRRAHLVPHGGDMRAVARIAWLPAVQLTGGVVTNFVFIRVLGNFGDAAQTAFAISLRIGLIVPMICFPLAGACATLVGQALGAGDVPRAWQAVRIGLWVHGSIMCSFAAGILFFRHALVAWLSDDPQVMALGADFLLYAGCSFFFYALYFIVLRSLQGAGDFAVPMAMSLGSTLFVAIPGAFLLVYTAGQGPVGVAQAQLLSAGLLTLGTGAWFLSGRWTHAAQALASATAPMPAAPRA